MMGSKTSDSEWRAGDIHGFTCVFCGDWVTQSDPCPSDFQLRGQRPGASSGAAVHEPQRHHHAGKVRVYSRLAAVRKQPVHMFI